MIGIDTNVLLRLATEDDIPQKDIAIRYIRMHCTVDQPGWVNLIVLSDFVWVLSSNKSYGYGRDQIIGTLEKLLNLKVIKVEHAEIVWLAIADYKSGAKGFVDCLINRLNRFKGVDYTITFDQEAARFTGVHLLQ